MSNIKVGDLVMVVKPAPCCGSTKNIGKIFKVTELSAGGICSCGALTKINEKCARTGDMTKNGLHISYQVNRLIKIDPPSLPETIETEKELSV
jgi:hypothetical protein